VLYQPAMDLLVQIAVIRERVAAAFLNYQNVVACGIGFKTTQGQQTWVPSVVLSVVRKMPQSELPESQILPKLIEGIPTDVIETGEIAALGIDRIGIVRPLQPGVSIGHRDGTAGTLGCIVRRGEDQYLLSNNHVLALLNRAEIGDPILQPGPGDGGTLNDHIGKLAGYEKIRFSADTDSNIVIIDGAQDTATPQGGATPQDGTAPQGCAALIARLFGSKPPMTLPTEPAPGPVPVGMGTPENRVDAAIAQPLRSMTINPLLAEVNSLPSGVADPKLGMHVFKSGRSTGVTEGFITQVDVTVDVQYGARRARYVNQMMTTRFSDRGDSGSLVINGQREAVGLIFSGSELISVASPIRFVLSALRVELVTG
jgi:hypothetical protein